MNGLIIFVFPVVCAITEASLSNVPASWKLCGKWFVFWAFGFRLFATGIKQASDPSFSITKINKNNVELYDMARGLGIANICLGAGGILSLINETWRQVIAIMGCLFFAL